MTDKEFLLLDGNIRSQTDIPELKLKGRSESLGKISSQLTKSVM